MKHRISSLERLGMRSTEDFNKSGLQELKNGGFTGVLVNGGAGIGPDMICPECLAVTDAIPELAPLTTAGSIKEFSGRVQMTVAAGLKPWLNVWGAPGPDLSAGSEDAISNKLFDRRTKLEMHACLARHPELFGFRRPDTMSWRGSRPLCVSHPTVQAFYAELFQSVVQTYPDLEGAFFFPGDSDPEICDATCPRCSGTGNDSWQISLEHVNRIFSAIQAVRPGFQLYFAIWNQDQPKGRENIQRFLDGLHPEIGVCMSLSDHVTQQRRSGEMRFNQPWCLMPEPGDLFLWTRDQCRASGRSVMVFGEINQSEVWDPVCHNVPLPAKTLRFLQAADAVSADGLHDFWGHRSPYLPHANLDAMAEYQASPGTDIGTLLKRTAARHYRLPAGRRDLIDLALECWEGFDRTVDGWALTGWGQRFSFAIGRDAARGRFYQALLPGILVWTEQRWGLSTILQDGKISPVTFSALQSEDRLSFLEASKTFGRLGEALDAAGLAEPASLAGREAETIELAGELIASVGRTVLAIHHHKNSNWQALREVVLQEIASRERQIQISGKIGHGGGVNQCLVLEDIQNMRLFLSHPAYPHVPEELFSFTVCPYTA